MWCQDHKIEYGTLTCPRCRQEEEEREERRKINSESIEEQRRQTAILERQLATFEKMRAEKEQREREQQAVQERIAAAEQERLEEEREHRREEQRKAALRAGLPEFPEEFREKWRQANEQIKKVQRLEEVSREDIAHMRKEIKHKKEAITNSTAAFQNRLSGEFYTDLHSKETQAALALLPHGRCDDLPGFAPASEAYRRLLGSKFVASIRHLAPRELPHERARLAVLLELLETAASRAKPLHKWGCLSYIILWFGIYILVGFVLLAILSLLESNTDPAATFATIAAFVGVMAAYSISERKRQENDLHLNMFIKDALELAMNISATSEGIPPRQLTEMIRDARLSLAQPLFADYFSVKLGNEAEGLEIKRLAEELQTAEGKLTAFEEEVKAMEYPCKVIKHRYTVFYEQILRMGVEVIEGLRVPGSKVAMTRCGSCSELLDASLKICPFCDPNITP